MAMPMIAAAHQMPMGFVDRKSTSGYNLQCKFLALRYAWTLAQRLTSPERLKMNAVNKLPQITLSFWIIKILATTLGETGGDTVTMTLDWGYLAGTVLFLGALVILVFAQIAAQKFHPFLYWSTIIASTTFGTTMADFTTRSLGIGYAGGAALLLSLVLASLLFWRRVEGSISVDSVKSARTEAFYWASVTLSQTLGTALGDWMADDTGLGYLGGACVFTAGLALIVLAYYKTPLSRVTLFWAAFILTRPLGATVGDFLDKPVEHGGLALSRPAASVVLTVIIVLCVALLPQRTKTSPVS